MSGIIAFVGQLLVLRSVEEAGRKEFLSHELKPKAVHVPTGAVLELQSIGQYAGRAELPPPDARGHRLAAVTRQGAPGLRFANGTVVPLTDIGVAFIRVVDTGAV